MTQGYIIQFYHPIEADLPEDIRDDWIQWHHEELIRDNKVFETVQLKLDIQMRFLLFFIVIISFLETPAKAYGGILDSIANSKEHKYCADIAKRKSANLHVQEETYHACRSDIDLEKKLEKDFQDWKRKNKRN